MIYHPCVYWSEDSTICQDNTFIGHKLMMDADSPSWEMSTLIYLFHEHYKALQKILCQVKDIFHSVFFAIIYFSVWLFLCAVMSETWEYQLWFDICPGMAGVLKAERHSINPMRNMFTGKQNVINPTIYQVFDRKQKPAGISLTSVSCDASGQKSWNHSPGRRRAMEGEKEREATAKVVPIREL